MGKSLAIRKNLQPAALEGMRGVVEILGSAKSLAITIGKSSGYVSSLLKGRQKVQLPHIESVLSIDWIGVPDPPKTPQEFIEWGSRRFWQNQLVISQPKGKRKSGQTDRLFINDLTISREL